MSFKDVNVKKSYISFGEDNIAKALIEPLLYHAKLYKRSVGFFSSSVFSTIMEGVVSFARNGGKIQLITSPNLSEDDVEAINGGYTNRELILINKASDNFAKSIQDFEVEELKLLYELISNSILDIKIVVTKTAGMYHDKLGIMRDNEGNEVVFYGSPNSTHSGYSNNYEKIRVVNSWNESDKEIIDEENKEFDGIWTGDNKYLEVYEFSGEAKNRTLSIIEYKEMHGSDTPVILRDYQEAAINSWKNNNYKGFFVMATGTGKTWTALFATKELMDEENPIVVICAPYKHLVKQWAEDVEKMFTDSKMVLVSSENPNWEKEINAEIIRLKYKPDNKLIIISTISSFYSERFIKSMRKSDRKKLLIVDEAHRFTQRDDQLKAEYSYLLGLSATPDNGKQNSSGEDLMDFFGGKVYDLPIERAIGKHLVNYSYHPIYVYATEDEEDRFKKLSSKIMGCFKNGVLIDKDALIRYSRERLRIISMAHEKTEKIDYILDKIEKEDHFVVYCGDGKIFNNEEGEKRHIQFIKDVLDKRGLKSSQFTATENMKTRMRLVKAFNTGEIDALAAIRCLDEGINIPSIRSALILSSNDSYREFVQRRGRILRLYKDKTEAKIYDVIVLPSLSAKGMAVIELRRYYEYAKLAVNSKELIVELEKMMDEYGVEYEEILFVGSQEEESLDE